MEIGDPTALVFYVNGIKVEEHSADPETTLMQYLRTKLRLCGTKNSCSEGGCGACTVMISKLDRQTKSIKHYSANACLLPICALYGLAVTTVEGVGSVNTIIHPIQDRLAKNNGSQCGFCTPGFVMAMYALLRTNSHPTKEAIEAQLTSNLCRCTGYRPILQSFYTFAEPDKENAGFCCNGAGKCACKDMRSDDETLPIHTTTFASYDTTQEPIFPPEITQNDLFDQTFLKLVGPKSTWYRPVLLDQLLHLKSIFPDAKMVIGNTSVGLIKKFSNITYPVLVSPVRVPELREVRCTDQGIIVGAALTWGELEVAIVDNVKHFEECSRVYVNAVLDMIRSFEYPHLKNVSSFIGNVTTASSMSDMSTVFLAIGAKLNVISAKTRQVRELLVDQKFFPAQHKTLLTDDEIVLSVLIPKSPPECYTEIYKQQQGQHKAKVAISAQFAGTTVKTLRLSLAGVGVKPVMIEGFEGRDWSDETMSLVIATVISEITQASKMPVPQYKMSLYLGFFFKFYVKMRISLEKIFFQLKPNHFDKPMLASVKSAAEVSVNFEPVKAIQIFSKVPNSQKDSDDVGRAVAHKSALLHTTGEAVYADDVPIKDCLHLGLVQSTKAHAKIKSIDTTDALKLDGVVGIVDVDDVPKNGRNLFGIFNRDEFIFADKEVFCEGQLICAVAATTNRIAQEAAALVKVEYQELPAIVTIEDAIAAGSYHCEIYVSKVGDVESALTTTDNKISGEFRGGGQEHFYMETQSAIVIPKEDEFEVIASSQNPSAAQTMAAEVLGVPLNKVVAKIKRLGGAFGGKEGKICVSLGPAAVAANKFKVPVKNILTRDQDMKISGGRHPFLAKYELGFSNAGLITALRLNVYMKGGYAADVTPCVSEVVALAIDGAYKVPNLYVAVHSCKTNAPSNTAFRGFGRPQCQLIREHLVSAIAHKLSMDPVKVREENLYKEGDQIPGGQLLTDCHLKRCWNECLTESNYYERRREVDSFNSRNRWVKRGITAIPLKYSLGMPLCINQGAALVHIYLDGTVLITHGGIEMGQGLYTKLIQIATRALNVPADMIHISDSSSDKVPNTTATAGSSGTDLYGGAVEVACEILHQRLEPIVKQNPDKTWVEVVNIAYLNRISLSTTGYYKTAVPDPNFDNGITKDTAGNVAYRFRYFVYGAVCCEVEIDCLTGTHKVIRADMVMDVGESLNPAIDIGQIEGAFMQGYGLCTLEDHRYSPAGNLQTVGPRVYTIPRVKDVPRVMNVHLLKDSKCPVNVYSSKGVGEPPLLLGTSVLFAIQDAINSARVDANCAEAKLLDSPATAEQIRMACEDAILQEIQKKTANP